LTALGFGLALPLSGTRGTVVSFLLPAALAFGIGVRFRSRWWALGPLTALSLPFIAGTVVAWIQDPGNDAWGWLLVFSVMAAVYGALLSLAALAGVWWGKRRHDSHVGSRDTGLPARGLRPWGSWPT
jgi:hypothetical protein